MGQPEMRPEDTVRQHGGCRAGLPGRTFPPGDWSRPAEHLEELYVWVEQRALLVGDWYLADRVAKRRGARVLRTGAAAGVAAGAAVPLLALTGALARALRRLGLPRAAVRGVCVGGDRCFGLTPGWMRDVATAQAVQRRLESLQYDWASRGRPRGARSDGGERGRGRRPRAGPAAPLHGGRVGDRPCRNGRLDGGVRVRQAR